MSQRKYESTVVQNTLFKKKHLIRKQKAMQ